MQTSIIIIIAIIALIIVWSICYICGRNNQPNIEQFKLGYANSNDPYDKPFILNDFISKDHCKQIMDYSRNKLFDSEVVGGKDKTIRNSQQCWIPRNHPLAKPIFEKVSQKFGIAIENSEDLQVVRYLPGQYYNEHHDSCCDNNEKCVEFVKRGGQRVLTVLIYLNNDFENGYTYFPKLNLKVKPPPGSAIVFRPLAQNSNKCHPSALHAGVSLTGGEKWVCNVWMRESKFQ